HRDCFALIESVRSSGPFDGLLAVSRGGLAPAAILSAELSLRRVEVIAISSYDGRSRGDAKILKDANLPSNSRWLVIDDIADSGETMKLVREQAPDAVYAAVYAKPAGRPFVDHFAVEVAQEDWVVFPWDPAGDTEWRNKGSKKSD
ncbi:MAG TPA: xanthine phosphoribosyltransferase, partial [Rhodospirillaceae bacterium]|nr:xanthine phosphoribosyltransferase [Rhodospirillaceae bacterium]